MRPRKDRRLIVTAGCTLLLAAGWRTAGAEDKHGYSTLKVVSGPQATAEVEDAPPAYVAPSPSSAPTPSPEASRPAFRPAAAPASFPSWPQAQPQVTNQTRQALGFYGGASARATLNEMPRRVPVVSSPPPPQRRQSKPFQTVWRDPTVSPYLNLYREDIDSEAAPNYFAFVRPQLDQIEINRRQQRELQQLRRQVQGYSGEAVGPQYQAADIPGTGHVARFMDTAQFYGQWQR